MRLPPGGEALLERDEEVRALDALVRAGAGAVVVEGPHGVGETRLLELARRLGHAAGMRVRAARGLTPDGPALKAPGRLPAAASRRRRTRAWRRDDA